MAVTRLKRKALRNCVNAAVRKANIKRLTAMPVIKTIDVEALKASFVKN
jgi:hypothetical protein